MPSYSLAFPVEDISIAKIASNGFSYLSNVWHYKILSLESQSVTVANITTAIIALVIGLRVARYLSASFKSKLFAFVKLDKNSTNIIGRIVDYLFLVIVIIIVLDIAGVPLNIFTFIGGAFVISIGLSSQHLFNNFLSGIALIIENNIRVGDLIEFDNIMGRVESIEARMVQIRTQTNLEIFIPHSKLMQERFTNWTYNSGLVRVSTEIKIEQQFVQNNNLKDILLSSVKQSKYIITIPEPQVLLLNFENNIINYEVNVWINVQDVDRRVALSEVNNLILQGLKNYNIPLAISNIRYTR
jgi:potassium efflux system protein